MAAATKKKTNTSAKIREMLAAGKEPMEIAQALKLKSPSLIYQVRAKAKGKRRKSKTAHKTHQNCDLSLEGLLQAKKLVEGLGSIENAKAALNAIEKLN
jgi:hypothetical protein